MGAVRDAGGHHDVPPPVARRRIALLVVALAAPAVLVLTGTSAAWALFAVPVAVAVPLAGLPGLLGAIATAACVITVASGRPDADGAAMALGLGAFVTAGIAVGLGHAAQAAAARRARSLGFADRVTAVAGEEYFLHALGREAARAARHGTPLSVVVLDVDRFADFNRAYGAVVGDRLVEAVGRVLRETVDPWDIAARLDGGQFGILVPGTAEEAVALADRVRAIVGTVRLPASRGRQASATISAGVADYAPGDDPHGTAVLDRAERALDDAKAEGRDRVMAYSPERHRWASSAA